MRNAAEVALRTSRDPEQYRRVLEEMLEEIERLTRLVEQLLFLCRGDAGLVPLSLRPVRLGALIEEVAEHMRAFAEARGLALTVTGAAPSPVRGDEDQLRRLLFNLLDNAIKYTPSGGTIAVRVTCPDGRTQVEVADTGIGIAPSIWNTSSSGSIELIRLGAGSRTGRVWDWRSASRLPRPTAGRSRSRAPSAGEPRVTLTLPATDDGEAVSRPC